jgi:hypothetical protein
MRGDLRGVIQKIGLLAAFCKIFDEGVPRHRKLGTLIGAIRASAQSKA